LVSLLLVALLLGLIPDRTSAIRQGRAVLAESVAVNVTSHVVRHDARQMRADLGLIVERNKDLLSAGIRRRDDYDFATENHEENWRDMSGEYSSDSQVLVPIYSNQKKWGQLELRFASNKGLFGIKLQQSQSIRLIVFLAASSFFVFYLYLGKMLKHLDPTRAIPQRVRAALDTMAEGLLVVDIKGQIVLANEAIGAILEKDVDELLGWKVDDFGWELAMDPEDKGLPPWQECLRSGKANRNSVVHLQHIENNDRTFIVNCSPVMAAAGGKLGGALISFDDVTQLEEKKKELDGAKQAAEAANRSKSEFLANMSHEIRTPMNAILGFTDILRRGYGKSQEDPRKYLNTIHSSGMHLLELINDILDLSKVEAGRLDVERIPCGPHVIIKEVIQVLAAKAQEKGISLDFEANGPVPETILSDPGRLRQIVTNLTGNAIKFTETGSVTVAVQMTGDTEPQYRIDVRDSGIGMTQDQMERIFDPFSQADSSVTRKFGGTGLGLTISRRFTEALGGEIAVQSEPGKGSVFSVTIDTGPLENVTMLQSDQLDIEPTHKTEQSGSWRFDDQRVLVVDDGQENRELVTLVLQEVGLQVECAENGQVAVEMASRTEFDLILMDMQMPIMDGYQATRTLRENGFSIPIFALTAHAMKGFEADCLEAGCSGYLTKPVNIDLLLETVARVLGGTRTEYPPATVDQTRLASPITTGESSPIVSRLPTDDPVFAKVVVSFVSRLDGELEVMRQALAAKDFPLLFARAHWLKGSGGTVGFDEFTEPAGQLEAAAKNAKLQLCDRALDDIVRIARRIQLPGTVVEIDHSAQPKTSATNNAPLISQLPAGNPRFQHIVANFVPRLAEKLEEMQCALQQSDYSRITELAHWLKGAGGTVGFPQFTEPAGKLEHMARRGDSQEHLNSLVAELLQLSSRIRIPDLQPPASTNPGSG
ncbi:MAG: ATP-binding protein, partial [Pirellulaceae bacterium]